MPNRIEAAIERRQEVIDGLEQDRLGILERSVNSTSAMELNSYQEIRSLAQASGLLTPEESQQAYDILGGEMPTDAKWRERTTAEKATVITLMGELMCAMHLGGDSRHARKRRRR